MSHCRGRAWLLIRQIGFNSFIRSRNVPPCKLLTARHCTKYRSHVYYIGCLQLYLLLVYKERLYVLLSVFQQLLNLPKIWKPAMSVADDDDWRRVRQIISPSFTSGKLRNVILIVFTLKHALRSCILLYTVYENIEFWILTRD